MWRKTRLSCVSRPLPLPGTPTCPLVPLKWAVLVQRAGVPQADTNRILFASLRAAASRTPPRERLTRGNRGASQAF